SVCIHHDKGTLSTGTLSSWGRLGVRGNTLCRGDVMRKIVTALVAAATIAGAAVATSSPAAAWRGGWHGGGWGFPGRLGLGLGRFRRRRPGRLRARRTLLLPLRLLRLWPRSLPLLRPPLLLAAGLERLCLGARLRLTANQLAC